MDVIQKSSNLIRAQTSRYLFHDRRKDTRLMNDLAKSLCTPSIRIRGHDMKEIDIGRGHGPMSRKPKTTTTSTLGYHRTFCSTLLEPNIREMERRGTYSRGQSVYRMWVSTTPIGPDMFQKSSKSKMTESTLILQEGSDMEELPVAVLRTNPCSNSDNDPTRQPKPYVDLDPREEAAFVSGFSSYHTPQEVLRVLDTIPSQEVTPVVALSVLRKLIELESNFGFRNDGKSWIISVQNSSVETFARMAIVTRLIDIIMTSDKCSVLVEALEVLGTEKPISSEDRTVPHDQILQFSNYRTKLCDEVLMRTSQGALKIEEVCRVVKAIGQIRKTFQTEIPSNFIDKFWVGILDKRGMIDLSNLVPLFETIPYFEKSRSLVLNLLERKVLSLWWQLDLENLARICEILSSGGRGWKLYPGSGHSWGISARLLMSLSRCLSLNLHKVREDELLRIVKSFMTLEFCDHSMQKVLDKYMKAKGVKISDPNLISSIMDYVRTFRLRSPHILDAVSEYVILHNGSNLSAPQLSSILLPFGLLDFQPLNGFKFWEIVERVISEKFVQFPPKDLIEVLLSCIYLGKYPLNFVNRVFSPYFLDRLHTSEMDTNVIFQVRSRLKLLDTALTLECGSRYAGPLLPRDFRAKTTFVDGRIGRMEKYLLEPLETLFPRSNYMMELDVVLPNVPFNALYIVNVLICPKETMDHPNSEQTPLMSELLMNRITPRGRTEALNQGNVRAPLDMSAILINIPEHYSEDGKHLIGPEIMRIRHLRLLGFSVVNLKYTKLSELKGHHNPDDLVNYLRESIKLVNGKPQTSLT